MGTNDANNEDLLIQRLKNGDHSAFYEIFTMYFSPLRFFADNITNDIHEAEDIVIVAFYNLWKRHKDFDLFGSVKAFLYITVRNNSLKYIRDRNRKIENQKGLENLLPEIDDPRVNKHTMFSRLLDELLDAMDGLSERHKQILDLTYWKGMKTSEIAEILKIKPDTVSRQRTRALELLRETLRNRKLILLFWRLIKEIRRNIARLNFTFGFE